MSFSGWGNYPRASGKPLRFDTVASLQGTVRAYDGLIARGNGRSYGDSALGENLVLTRPYNYFLDFDESSGVLHCQAGVLLADILETFVPRGWFLSVTPGTKLITVGGAIASDVHGKNHHVAGTFSSSVVEFSMVTRDGNIVRCSQVENRDLFNATCGGMGLTGIILDAKIRLLPITSSLINQTTIKTRNLGETFAAFEQYRDSTYSVAWIDCLASGRHLGRSLVMLGEHREDGGLSYLPGNGFSVPFYFPSGFLNRFSIRLFNSVYYGKASNSISSQVVDLDSYFYPLDAIDHWNRMYGKKGFMQYQFVLPLDKSYEGMEKVLGKIARAGKGSFLAVLKLFGKANDNWLSFPMEGYTLSLDFKVEPKVFRLFEELDKIVLDHGGRFYLAKDARITREKFQAGYRDVDKFRDLRRKQKMASKFSSLQSKRIDI
ncbi:FAD-binding oxidoreductase [Kaarinaea lacus]